MLNFVRFTRLAWCCLLAYGFLLDCAGATASDETSTKLSDQFRSQIQPLLVRSCVGCHQGGEPEGDLDLSRFDSANKVAAELPLWDGVLKQVEMGRMPPKRAKDQPNPAERAALVDWIKQVRAAEATRNAGDPGLVPARRLSNAEFDNTIRDLTGVDLRPTREFPVDPANEAGFDNSGESLTMSPALARKYLDAARAVSDHLVFKLDGLSFAEYPMRADTDRDKYCVRSIIDFYKAQKTDLADFFIAAWRYKHRAELGRADTSLDTLADEAGLSRQYLKLIWNELEAGPEPVGPLAALRTLWRGLSAKEPEANVGCIQMRDFVNKLRAQLVPEVKNLTAPGIGEGTQPFVLWKNRQFVANRRRPADGITKLKIDDLVAPEQAKALLTPPAEPTGDAARAYEHSLASFCNLFPDAFYVSERARVFLGTKGEQGNAGRLLSAGFHSMTGYFRDDGPLYDLILDDAGRQRLDQLWREFNSITNAPLRQYSSHLWFERAETGFLKGDPAFDFVRAEDPDAASAEKMGRFADAYLTKARRQGASPTALAAIESQFGIFTAEIQRAEADRRSAEPQHLRALLDFAGRAYRRPLSGPEQQGILAFYQSLRTAGGLDHEDAVRDTLTSILISPQVCYRVNRPGETSDNAPVRPISDFDLASRLSYFLWASLPDSELLALAQVGELHQPAILAAQARRMLKDERVRGLATEFGGNWLDFRRFQEHNSVDRAQFTQFNDGLRQAMFEEPIRFLVDLIQNDRPVIQMLSGTHTFVNAPLAQHYGLAIPGLAGRPANDWVKIDDATPQGRGGLLPMAVFLTRNSPGLRTSPVKRGYWVVKRLLGEAIPPPPASVPDLPDSESKLGDLTLREVLERHRADSACSGCHERFDGLGLAFEGYGPIGEARILDLGGRKVDPHAAFPGGQEGTGVSGLRAYLLAARGNEFQDNLCRKLLAYALGRSLILSDDSTVAAMRDRLEHAPGGGSIADLVEVIVTSPQFLNVRISNNSNPQNPE